MPNSECPVEDLIVGYFRHFERVNEVEGILRIKWVLNNELSTQMDEDKIKLWVIRAKNKTL